MGVRSGALMALLLAVATANAEDNISLRNPQYGGTGCPAGTANVVLSDDQRTISILFDNYVAEAGGNKSFDRKNCNIAIPVHVPQGISVSVFAIDYRGFAGIPSGGRGQLNVDYFLAGLPGGVHTAKTFTGPSSADYLKHDNLELDALVWSPCGADTILRTNTTLLAQSNRSGDEVMATVDSADVHAGIVYHVQWRSCR